MYSNSGVFYTTIIQFLVSRNRQVLCLSILLLTKQRFFVIIKAWEVVKCKI